MKQRVIVCAAVLERDSGLIHVGPRHYDSTMIIHMKNGGIVDQGFIDQQGVFMTREEAWEVAKAAGQIKYRCGGDEGRLFSENLY